VVSRSGTAAAALVPIEQWRRLQAAARPRLKELLLSSEARTGSQVPSRGVARRRPAVERWAMAFPLDSIAVSERRRPRPHGAVLAWLQIVDDADLHRQPVTL